METSMSSRYERYSLPMRFLHWLRAALILGLIAVGWIMVSLADEVPSKYDVLYPTHKEFGVLLFLVAVVHMIIRTNSNVPKPAPGLKPWEVFLSRNIQRIIMALTLIVPLLGYSMSSSYTESDGVPFFFMMLPELLPKNDGNFVIFQWLHKILAFTLLGLVAVHVLGALKHRLIDRDPDKDALRRML